MLWPNRSSSSGTMRSGGHKLVVARTHGRAWFVRTAHSSSEVMMLCYVIAGSVVHADRGRLAQPAWKFCLVSTFIPFVQVSLKCIIMVFLCVKKISVVLILFCFSRAVHVILKPLLQGLSRVYQHSHSHLSERVVWILLPTNQTYCTSTYSHTVSWSVKVITFSTIMLWWGRQCNQYHS